MYIVNFDIFNEVRLHIAICPCCQASTFSFFTTWN